ncbi:Stf0 family sulfotransferase [Shimia sp. MMG029]|uniref:Stf0 family sulfotransferase n=1 Tax=Shimia sp. MMG029 TaxID=3021978 RepID=UPI003F91256E
MHAAVLRYLGLPQTTANHITPDTKKLADATSRDWIRHYQALTRLEQGHTETL